MGKLRAIESKAPQVDRSRLGLNEGHISLSEGAVAMLVALLPLLGIPIPLPSGFAPLAVIPLAIFCVIAISTTNLKTVFKWRNSETIVIWLSLLGYLVYMSIWSLESSDRSMLIFFSKHTAHVIFAYLFARVLSVLVSKAELQSGLVRGFLAGCIAILFFLLAASTLSPTSKLSDVWASFCNQDLELHRSNLQSLLLGLLGSSSVHPDDVPVLKNTFAEGSLALAIVGLAIAPISRHRGQSTLIYVCLIGLFFVVALTLSRSVMALGILAFVMFVCFKVAHKPVAGLLLLVGVFALLLAMFPFFSSIDSNELVVDKSLRSRIEQYASAASPNSTTIALLGNGPSFTVGDHRIHNLLLSTLAEGGILALSLVVIHYSALLILMAKAFRRGISSDARFRWLAYLAVTISLMGLLRTMSNGGGGFYSPAGLIGISFLTGISELNRNDFEAVS